MAPPALPSPGDIQLCSANAPAWFVDTHQEMSQTKLGIHFDALLIAWTRIEDA
jgi:hypothetical protein